MSDAHATTVALGLLCARLGVEHNAPGDSGSRHLPGTGPPSSAQSGGRIAAQPESAVL
jgi:hypothetical protein